MRWSPPPHRDGGVRRPSSNRASCVTTSKRPASAARANALARARCRSAVSSSASGTGAGGATSASTSKPGEGILETAFVQSACFSASFRDDFSGDREKQAFSISGSDRTDALQPLAIARFASSFSPLLTAGSQVRVQQPEPRASCNADGLRDSTAGGADPGGVESSRAAAARAPMGSAGDRLPSPPLAAEPSWRGLPRPSSVNRPS